MPPIQFFKVDDSTIYHTGHSYSFYSDLDPPKSSGNLQLRHTFHCALSEEENCRSRCHVTGNWEMDKKGRKFMLGIVEKNKEHNHEPEYRDTTPKLRFYRSGNALERNGYVYSFDRELDPPKQNADFQWHRTYRCSTCGAAKNCQARIYTTGVWERGAHQFQWGTFKHIHHKK
ncbi:hypothetical protein Ddc_12451 [Ditylenchus destructor]|nr:hypothetical protein Ddc_12451 [Ditylenchus destructor]